MIQIKLNELVVLKKETVQIQKSMQISLMIFESACDNNIVRK